MGSVHNASCQCGFETKVVVGGSMATFQDDSRFPYYCGHCGMVEANISKLISQGTASATQSNADDAPACPKCGNKNIFQYGKPPVSMSLAKDRVAIQAWDFKANREGHFCPSCKQMTLAFNGIHILFD